MSKFTAAAVSILTAATTKTLSSGELLDLYNFCAGVLKLPAVKRFSDRVTAERRTLAMLEDAKRELPAATEEAPKASEKAPKAPKPKKVGKTGEAKTRGMRFIFPVGSEGIKKHREGTNRAKLVEMLSTPEGATFEECYEATWGAEKGMDVETARKTTYEAVRLLHYYLGYGMKQDAEGRITLRKK